MFQAPIDSEIRPLFRGDKSMETTLTETTEEPSQILHHLARRNQGKLVVAVMAVRFSALNHMFCYLIPSASLVIPLSVVSLLGPPGTLLWVAAATPLL